MPNNIIPIVLITDNNYILPTLVCLESMKCNKSQDSVYEIHIISDNISKESEQELYKLSEENFNISVLKIDNQYKDLENKNDYVTNAAFLKFDIPFLLRDYDKILYIDVDIIVLKDLYELYDTELNDTFAGVISDVGELFYKRREVLGLKHYFNSGVILFNAKKCRESNISEKSLQIYLDNEQSFICHDQDTLNLVFQDNITLLSPKYNYQQSISEYPLNKIKKLYKKWEDELNIKFVVIVHYTRMKPWIYEKASLQKIWKKYYELSFGNSPLNLKSGLLLKIYFILRGYLNLKIINKIIKKIKS